MRFAGGSWNMMKKSKNLLSVVLAVVLMFSVLSVTVSAVAVNVDIEAKEYVLVWRVPPTLDYDRIWYCFCSGFTTINHGGMQIDRGTGGLTGELARVGDHCGQGYARWLAYDTERGLLAYPWGICAESFFPLNELKGMWSNLCGFLRVQNVDSSVHAITEWGVGQLTDDAFTGKFAVKYDDVLITDFIFDGDAAHGWDRGSVDGAIVMSSENRWGFIDRNGNVAIPFVFEHIVVIDNDTAFARYNGKYGILDVRSMIGESPASLCTCDIEWIIDPISTDRTITVTFGATRYYLDGVAFTQPTMVYNGVAYLPLWYLARRLDFRIGPGDIETNNSIIIPGGYYLWARQPFPTIPTPALGTRSINTDRWDFWSNHQYYLNGEALVMDILFYDHAPYGPAVPYWPAAYLARRLGFTAVWDAETNTTTLTSNIKITQ